MFGKKVGENRKAFDKHFVEHLASMVEPLNMQGHEGVLNEVCRREVK